VSANKIKKKNSKYDLNSKAVSTHNIIENSRLTSMNSFKREKLPKRTTITARSLWAKFQNYRIRQD